MKHYTSLIPHDLAEKLKAAGMPMIFDVWTVEDGINRMVDIFHGIYKEKKHHPLPSYAEVFDWLMEKGYDVEAYLSMTKTSKDGSIQRLYAWIVNTPTSVNEATSRDMEYDTWHEAANKAIEKAIELI